MKAIVRCVAACTLMILLGQSAGAEVLTFRTAGGWQAFGGRSEGGRKLCGVSATGDGRWFAIKYFEGDSSFTVQLTKDSWTLRQPTQVDVIMQFDRGAPWEARAMARPTNAGVMVEFSIREQAGKWLTEFLERDTLYVKFPNSGVDAWQADLRGTQEIGEAMRQCLLLMRYSQRSF